jgi:hypothetical protein
MNIGARALTVTFGRPLSSGVFGSVGWIIAWIAVWLIAGSSAGMIAGCSSNQPERDFDLLVTRVHPIEYARILCSGIDIEDRHSCMTSVIQHHHAAKHRELTPDEVVNGPFVIVFGGDLYRGNYVSNPFASAFTVSNGYNICRGRFNAFAGDTSPVFRVACDDGSRGRARIVLDTSGRNGLGIAEMSDGMRGDIVFGHAAVGGAFL